MKSIARVSMTLEIDIDNFSPDETLGHMMKVAKEEALDRIRNIPSHQCVHFLHNSMTVMAVLIPEKQDAE